MTLKTYAPEQTSYDVITVGGAIMGASAAWFLSDNKDFDRRVLAVERVPELSIRSFGYMYLADNESLAHVLRAN